MSNLTETMDYYADVAKDPVKVQAVFDVLNEKGLVEGSGHYSPLINVYLNMVGSLMAVVVALLVAHRTTDREVPLGAWLFSTHLFPILQSVVCL